MSRTHSQQRDQILTISEWLKKESFKVTNVFNRVSTAGPDIIAQKGNQKIIVEVDTESPDNAVGKIIRRMDRYGFENTEYYISCWYPEKIPKIVGSLGIGVFILKDGSVQTLKPVSFFTQKDYSTTEKKKGEQIRIRCTWITKARFGQFAKKFKDYEVAVLYLLDNVVELKPSRVAVG